MRYHGRQVFTKKVKAMMTSMVVIAVAVFGLTACNPPPTMAITQYADNVGFQNPQCSSTPGCTEDNDMGGPIPVIEGGSANSCRSIYSTVNGQNTMCRVVDGLNDGGSCGAPCADHRNWEIVANHNLAFGNINAAHIEFGYGIAVGTDDGGLYEGCELLQTLPNGTEFEAICDFRVRKPLMDDRGGNSLQVYLDALWLSGVGAAEAAGCAYGLATLSPSQPWAVGSPAALFCIPTVVHP